MVYTAILEPEVTGGFSAHIPALPGVHSSGGTRPEALERIAEAAALWVEVEREYGRQIPPNEPLVVIAAVSRIIAEQRSDGLDPQLEVVSVVISDKAREAA